MSSPNRPAIIIRWHLIMMMVLLRVSSTTGGSQQLQQQGSWLQQQHASHRRLLHSAMRAAAVAGSGPSAPQKNHASGSLITAAGHSSAVTAKEKALIQKFLWAIPEGNIGCWYANIDDFPHCSGYKSVGFTCVGVHCAQMDADYPSLLACAKKAAAGTVLDASTGMCVAGKATAAWTLPLPNVSGTIRHSSGVCLDAIAAVTNTTNGHPLGVASCNASSPTQQFSLSPDGNLVNMQAAMGRCWSLNTDDYPGCSGYPSVGYTCVGKHCAGIDPVGNPITCAKESPVGYVVDAATGTCVAPHKGQHGQRMCAVVELWMGPGVVMWSCPGPATSPYVNTPFTLSKGTLCSRAGPHCSISHGGDCKPRCLTVKATKPPCQPTTPGCTPPAPPPMPKPTGMPCKGMCWNFTYTCRVASIEAAPWETLAERAQPRVIPKSFTWRWGKDPVTSNGTGWTPVTPFLGAVDGAKWARLYPNTGGLWFQKTWSVEHITVSSVPPRPANDTSLWNVECRLDGGDFMRTPTGALVPIAGDFLPLTGKLWGRNDLGVLVINNVPCPTCAPVPKSNAVTTMLRYNQHHYGPNFASAPVVTQKPRHFPITDGYTGGDTDYSNAQWGLTQMDRIGFHGLCSADRHTYEILKALGQNLTCGAFPNGSPYVEPGTGGTFNTTIMDAWAEKQAAPFKVAGWDMNQVANIAIADEPGWYFPKESPELYMNTSTSIYATRQRAEWVAYLQQQQPPLTPTDFGASSWDALLPSPQRWDWVGNKTLPLVQKKLFYWTVKFSIHASAVAFSRATKALERAFTPGVNVFSNFNNFHGRAYVPYGTSSDGAALAEDMFEFARNRATTLLWTEDWFGDGSSGQWSYYMARFRSAARLAPAKDVGIGGYIVGRTSGHMEIKLKALSQIAGGAKGLRYYTFGPEYNFPGNSYSGVTSAAGGMLAGMASAHEMIAKAEDILWTAQCRTAEVAILYPQSATYWDLLGMKTGAIIKDGTNHNLESATTDYLAEVWGLWQAMALYKNIPVDFIDEAGLLEPETLEPFKVLIVTEPDLPAAGAAALGKWVQAGGTLITIGSAGAFDQYHEPSNVLAKLSGMVSKRTVPLPAPGSLYQADRFYWGRAGPMFVQNGTLDASLCPNATLCKFAARGSAGEFALGVTGPIENGPWASGVLATYADGKPCIRTMASGKGAYIHFAWQPGISFMGGRNAYQPLQQDAIASLLQNMLQHVGVGAPVSVSVDNVEAPMLTGPDGDVVIVLNHAALGNVGYVNSAIVGNLPLELNVTLGYTPSSVTSVELGTLQHELLASGQVSLKLQTLHFADMVVFRR